MKIYLGVLVTLFVIQVVFGQVNPAPDSVRVAVNTPICIDVLANDGITSPESYVLEYRAADQTTLPEGTISVETEGFYWERSENVVIEAERFAAQIPAYKTYEFFGDNSGWEISNQYAGASKNNVIRYMPNANVGPSGAKWGVPVRYNVRFAHSGVFYISARGRTCGGCMNTTFCSSCADPLSDNTFHVLESAADGSIRTLTGRSGLAVTSNTSFVWASKAGSDDVTMTVYTSDATYPPSAKTIYIAPREDGVVVDKLLLSTNPNAAPNSSVVGPSETTYLNCANKILYWPKRDFSGNDSFVYRVSNNAQTATGVVNVFVDSSLPQGPSVTTVGISMTTVPMSSLTTGSSTVSSSITSEGNSSTIVSSSEDMSEKEEEDDDDDKDKEIGLAVGLGGGFILILLGLAIWLGVKSKQKELRRRRRAILEPSQME